MPYRVRYAKALHKALLELWHQSSFYLPIDLIGLYLPVLGVSQQTENPLFSEAFGFEDKEVIRIEPIRLEYRSGVLQRYIYTHEV